MRRFPLRSRATVALLLFVLLFLPACQGSSSGEAEGATAPRAEQTVSDADINRAAGEENAVEKTAPERTAPETTPTADRRPVEATFVHRANGENSRGDYTYLSDPSINGDPDATVFVAPTAETARAFDHNIGVWFEPERQQWAIFNQDRAAMPEGSAFEVVVPPEESFVHIAEPEDGSSEGTYIDDPLLNGKPQADPSVTQNWNPGGGVGVYNDHPIGVRYDAGRGKWEIFNRDGAQMPDGAPFNVTIADAAGTTSGEIVNVDTGEAPRFRNFFTEKGDPKTPQQFVSSDSSTGAIPVVKPFNFGRDPGGPEDKTLSLTIPKIGLQDIPVFDTVSEERLREGTVHVPATGYPWQEGANVFIAGHRIGFENTLSYYVFFRLDELQDGDEIQLEDANGRQFVYKVSKRTVVGPESVDVMNAVEDKSLITLQTCTLPDYEERLIIQGTMVEQSA